MPNKPKKWIAALLGGFAPPLGMLYVAKIRWALIYLLTALTIGIAGLAYIRDEAIAGAVQIIFVVICAIHAYRLASVYPDDKCRPTYSRWYGLLGVTFGLFSVAFLVRAFIVEPFRFPSGSMLPTIPLQSHLIVKKWGYGNYGTYGAHLFRSPISAPLSRGDIIVFEFPLDRSINYAKRLIGLPGDNIEYRNKHLIINGQPVKINMAGAYQYVGHDQHLIQSQVHEENLDTGPYTILLQPEQPTIFSNHVAAFPHSDHCQFDESGFICNVPEGNYLMLGDNRDASNDSRYWGFVPSDHIVGKVLHIFK